MFNIHNLAEAKIFLENEIHYDHKNRNLKFTQKNAINKLLKTHGMFDCNGINIPIQPKLKLSRSNDQ